MVSEVYYEVHTARISNVNSVMFVNRIREMESSPRQHLRQFMENSVEKCILMLGCQGLKLKVLLRKAEVRCDCVGQGWVTLNPLNLQSDQNRISPYRINTLSSRQVMRIKKNINKGITSWSNTKFSRLASWELYVRQGGELLMRSWEWKGEFRPWPRSFLCPIFLGQPSEKPSGKGWKSVKPCINCKGEVLNNCWW